MVTKYPSITMISHRYPGVNGGNRWVAIRLVG